MHTENMKDVDLSLEFVGFCFILFRSKNELELACGKPFQNLGKLLGFANCFLAQNSDFHTMLAQYFVHNSIAPFPGSLIDNQYEVILL